MTELEIRINAVIDSFAPANKASRTLSDIRKSLNSSSHFVDSITNFGDSLQNNIEECVGGVTGSVGGWMAGKTANFVGSLTGGIIAGTLKTVAGIIPDSSDIKLPEADRKIAHCIDTCPLPSDKSELFELLQYTWSVINSKSSPYGKRAIDSVKNYHSRAYSAFTVIAKDDPSLLQLSRSFMPKKLLANILPIK